MTDRLATLWRWLADGPATGPEALPWLTQLVALATAAMLLEAVLLLAWYHRTGAGLLPRSLLPTLAAGGGLMGALLAVLTGAPPICLLALLAVAGVAHVVDLRRRWQTGATDRRATGA